MKKGFILTDALLCFWVMALLVLLTASLISSKQSVMETVEKALQFSEDTFAQSVHACKPCQIDAIDEADSSSNNS